MSGITFSGDPGTTGREVFEDSTATGPGGKYAGNDTTTYTGQGDAAPGIGGGLHGQHGTGIATTGNDHHGHHHTHGPGCGHEGSSMQEAENIGGAAGLRTAEGMTGQQGTGQHSTGQHSHHSHHHERQEHSHHHDGGLGAAGTTGAMGAQGVTSGERHHGHGEHHHGVTGSSERPTGSIPDRTGPGGPMTSGAPTGGDRLDSGNDRSGLSGGQTGSHTGTGLTGQNTFDSVDHSTERAEGKSTGGIMGVLGTSDKDFTGRDRLPSTSTSAYTDNSGIHQSNTSGPGGASALTGREGNVANNPVAQAKDDVSGVHGQGVTGTHAGANDEAGLRNTSGPAGQAVSGEGVQHGETEHKGFVQKIKDML